MIKKGFIISLFTIILGFNAIAQVFFPEKGPLFNDTIIPRIDILIDPDSLDAIFIDVEGDFEFLQTDNDKIIAYCRENPNSNVLVILNLSDVKQEFSISSGEKKGNYRDTFTGNDFVINDSMNMELEAWDYLVLVKDSGSTVNPNNKDCLFL